VVLARERFAKGCGNHNARGEIGIAKDVETIAGSEGVGVDGVEAVGVGVLCGFPVL
jgi:hypothetical protein